MADEEFGPDYPFTTLRTAAAVTPVLGDAYSYTVDIKRDWCIGIVPHGGYITTVLLNASTHFFTHGPADIKKLAQPDAVLSSITFTTRCAPGPARLRITVIKLGRQYSVVRVDLSQSTLCLSGIITHGSLTREESGLHLSVPAPVYPSREICSNAGFVADPSVKFRVAASKLEYAYPPDTVLGSKPGEPWRRFQWVRLSGEEGQRIGVNDLAFLADMFLPLPENWEQLAKLHWYPTLAMTLDVKKGGYRGEGWEWVGMEIRTGVIRGGRMDIDVTMIDEAGEVIAISRHAALVVDVSRNRVKKGKESKL